MQVFSSYSSLVRPFLGTIALVLYHAQQEVSKQSSEQKHYDIF